MQFKEISIFFSNNDDITKLKKIFDIKIPKSTENLKKSVYKILKRNTKNGNFQYLYYKINIKYYEENKLNNIITNNQEDFFNSDNHSNLNFFIENTQTKSKTFNTILLTDNLDDILLEIYLKEQNLITSIDSIIIPVRFKEDEEIREHLTKSQMILKDMRKNHLSAGNYWDGSHKEKIKELIEKKHKVKYEDFKYALNNKEYEIEKLEKAKERDRINLDTPIFDSMQSLFEQVEVKKNEIKSLKKGLNPILFKRMTVLHCPKCNNHISFISEHQEIVCNKCKLHNNIQYVWYKNLPNLYIKEGENFIYCSTFQGNKKFIYSKNKIFIKDNKSNNKSSLLHNKKFKRINTMYKTLNENTFSFVYDHSMLEDDEKLQIFLTHLLYDKININSEEISKKLVNIFYSNNSYILFIYTLYWMLKNNNKELDLNYIFDYVEIYNREWTKKISKIKSDRIDIYNFFEVFVHKNMGKFFKKTLYNKIFIEKSLNSRFTKESQTLKNEKYLKNTFLLNFYFILFEKFKDTNYINTIISLNNDFISKKINIYNLKKSGRILKNYFDLVFKVYKQENIYNHIIKEDFELDIMLIKDTFQMYFKIKKYIKFKDYKNEINPKFSIKSFHDEITEIFNKIEMDEIKLDYTPDNLMHFEKVINNYNYVLPKSNLELTKWGKQLHHCVGGYFDSILNGHCYIVGVYDKNEELKYTMEINKNNNVINQCKTKFNDRPCSDVDFLESLKIYIEMNKLGYSEYSNNKDLIKELNNFEHNEQLLLSFNKPKIIKIENLYKLINKNNNVIENTLPQPQNLIRNFPDF
jgi:hypothetical protein